LLVGADCGQKAELFVGRDFHPGLGEIRQLGFVT
jgi:hypothetical protein